MPSCDDESSLLPEGAKMELTILNPRRSSRNAKRPNLYLTGPGKKILAFLSKRLSETQFSPFLPSIITLKYSVQHCQRSCPFGGENESNETEEMNFSYDDDDDNGDNGDNGTNMSNMSSLAGLIADAGFEGKQLFACSSCRSMFKPAIRFSFLFVRALPQKKWGLHTLLFGTLHVSTTYINSFLRHGVHIFAN